MWDKLLGPIISGLIFASSLRYLGLFLSLSLLLVVSAVVFVISKRYHQVPDGSFIESAPLPFSLCHNFFSKGLTSGGNARLQIINTNATLWNK